MHSPRLLRWLPWALFKTQGCAFTVLTKSLCSKGNPSGPYGGHSSYVPVIYCIIWRVSCDDFYLSLGIKFLIPREYKCLMTWDMEGNKDYFRLFGLENSHEQNWLSWVITSQTQFSSVQTFSRVLLFVTPWTAACQASLSFTISLSLLKLMFIESVMLSKHLNLCHPLLLLPSVWPLRGKVTYRCSHLNTIKWVNIPDAVSTTAVKRFSLSWNYMITEF